MNEVSAKKSLGQHWLDDTASLTAICQSAKVASGDTVLEVGPGHGSLTRQLLKVGAKVVAIEKDEALAKALTDQNLPNLKILTGDILTFDFNQLPSEYKLVANIPYYLTAHLLRLLSETSNPPAIASLLVQKEVAERVCAALGQMSLVAINTQLVYTPELGQVVPAKLFRPAPKVDSQVLILTRRPEPPFQNLDTKLFFRIAKAGFSGKRKKLRSSLSAGLDMSKEQADELLAKAGIDGNLRAQNLSLGDWHKLTQIFSDKK